MPTTDEFDAAVQAAYERGLAEAFPTAEGRPADDTLTAYPINPALLGAPWPTKRVYAPQRPQFHPELTPFPYDGQHDWPERDFPYHQLEKLALLKFSGEGPIQDYNNWIVWITKRLRRYPGYPHHVYIDAASEFLTGRALTWHNGTVDRHLENENRFQVTWDEWIDQLANAVRDDLHFTNMWASLPSIRNALFARTADMYKSNFDAYWMTLRGKLAREVFDRMAADALLGLVLPTGIRLLIPEHWNQDYDAILRTSLKVAAKTHRSTDVEMLAADADDDDGLYSQARLEIMATSAGSRIRQKPPKETRGKYKGPFANVPEAQRKKAFADGTCVYCLSSDHQAKDCPSKLSFQKGGQ